MVAVVFAVCDVAPVLAELFAVVDRLGGVLEVASTPVIGPTLVVGRVSAAGSTLEPFARWTTNHTIPTTTTTASAAKPARRHQ